MTPLFLPPFFSSHSHDTSRIFSPLPQLMSFIQAALWSGTTRPIQRERRRRKKKRRKRGRGGGGKEKKRGTTDALPFTLISRRECEFRPMILFFLSRASQSSSITTDFHVSPNYAPPPSGFVRNYRDFERVHAALSLISFFQTVFKSVSKSLNEDLVFERVAQME